MTKIYVSEYPGFAASPQGDTPSMPAEPASQNQVINTAATTGNIATLGAITAGTLYTNGTYNNVPLTGGTGSGATANITVSGGGVTAVQLVLRGTGYTGTDSLSAAAANIGGTGSGFAVAVGSLTQQITLRTDTRVVEIHSDGICSYRVGQDPVATTNDMRIAANDPPVVKGVSAPTGGVPAQGVAPTPWKISGITNT